MSNYNYDYNFKLEGKIFEQHITKDMDFSILKRTYLEQHINLLPDIHKNTIIGLSKKLNLILDKKSIVTIPIYVDEELDGLKVTVSNIKKQNHDFLAILYVNGHKPKNSSKQFKEKVSRIHDLVKDDRRFMLIENLYESKNKIGTIISDMYDSILLSLKRDAILIRIDSDLKELPENYFSDLNTIFETDSVSYVNSKLYYTKPDEHKFVRLSELMSDLGGYRNSKSKTQVPTYGPGMSVRASDLMRIKGTERDMERMEDYVIARKITQYYGSLENPDYSRGKWYDKVVYCSPRRQIQNLLEGRYFHENTYEFEFVDEKKIKKEKLDHYNDVVHKMINNSYVSLRDLNIIEDYINGFSLNRTNISKDFFNYRNNNMLERSFYEAKIKNNLIYFDEKNFIDSL